MRKLPEFPPPHAPLEAIDLPWTRSARVQLYLKREDLSHPFIAGNKWRKLKYHLHSAAELNCDSIITFGGAYSNHLLATAAAGAKHGFKTLGMVRGEVVENQVLRFAKLFGMQLRFLSRELYRDKEALYHSLQKEFPDAYLIPEGGSGPEGERGVAELVQELPMEVNHVICSVGTGSTMRGLLKGREDFQRNFSVQGIVVLKGAEEMQSQFTEFSSESYSLHHEFHFGGYAKTTPELWEFIGSFAASTGILLDQVYEGKMLFGLKSMVEAGRFEAGETIVALHNGGLVGMLS